MRFIMIFLSLILWSGVLRAQVTQVVASLELTAQVFTLEFGGAAIQTSIPTLLATPFRSPRGSQMNFTGISVEAPDKVFASLDSTTNLQQGWGARVPVTVKGTVRAQSGITEIVSLQGVSTFFTDNVSCPGAAKMLEFKGDDPPPQPFTLSAPGCFLYIFYTDAPAPYRQPGYVSARLRFGGLGVSITVDNIYKVLPPGRPRIKETVTLQILGPNKYTPSTALVKGKTTVTRAQIESENETLVSGVIGKMTAEAFPGEEVTAINSGRALAMPKGRSDPLNMDHSLNFVLPLRWTERESLHYLVTITKDKDTDVTSGYAPFSSAFPRPFRVYYLPICLPQRRGSPGAYSLTWKCPEGDYMFYDRFMRKVYPLANDGLQYSLLMLPDIRWIPHWDLLDHLGSPDEERLEAARLSLFLLRLSAMLRLPRGSQLFAWLGSSAHVLASHLDAYAHYLPAGFNRVWWAIDYGSLPEERERLLAHGIAHNLGLLGISGSEDARVGRVEGHGTDTNAYGLDPDTLTLVPWDAIPLMVMWVSARERPWISWFEWELLRSAGEWLAAAATPAAKHGPLMAASDQVLLISGEVKSDGSEGRLDPAYRLGEGGADSHDPEGNLCLRLKLAVGDPVRHCFKPPFESGVFGGASVPFAVSVPLPAGVQSITLVGGGKDLASLKASSAPPVVAIESPRPGDKWEANGTISWSGAGADGDPLTYSVLYSPDNGANWTPLKLDTTDTRYELDCSAISGGSQVMFRVMATSGLSSSSADVGPIEVIQRPNLTASAPALDFGNVKAGLSRTATLTVSNTGTGPVNLAATFDADSFRLAAPPQEFLLRAGAVRQLTISFAPSTAGAKNGTLTLADKDGGRTSLTVALTGAAFSADPPNITVTPPQLDFGSVPAGGGANLQLTFGNTGTAPLTVTALTVNNARFSVVSPAAPFTVAPGAQQDGTLRFSPTAAGAQQGSFTIVSNDPTRSRITVALAGTGAAAPADAPAITVSPAALEFGPVNVGQTKDLSAAVSNTGRAVLTVSALTTDNARFAIVSPAVPFNVPAGAQQNAAVRFSPAAAGAQQGALTIVSNDPARPRLTVALTGTGGGAPADAPAISVSPAALEFGAVNVGQTKELSAAVSNTGRAVLTVSALTTGNARFTVVSPAVPFNVAAGAQQNVTVRFSPTAAGAESGDLRITSNDPARATVTVRLTGAGVTGGAALINVTPARLDFGGVITGQQKDLAISVSAAAGAAALNISAIGIDNPSFTVLSPAAPVVVAGASAAAISVRFRPLAPGPQTGSLTIRSDAANTPVFNVPLTGAGVDAGDYTLAYDDGTREISIRAGAPGGAGYYFVRLTPPAYPATLQAVRIFFHDGAEALPPLSFIDLFTGENRGGAAVIDNLPLRSATVMVNPAGRFAEFTLASPIRITSGDFVAGFASEFNPDIKPAALDTFGPQFGRSYVSADGRTFRPITTTGQEGNLMIRGVVTVGN